MKQILLLILVVPLFTFGQWTQIGSDIDGEASDDISGTYVSLSADGTVLAIGAPQNDGINGANSGHVRVYENLGGTWTQVGSDIDGEAMSDSSGRYLSLSSNGRVLAIGASINNGGNGNLSGHVRVYENLGGTWTQVGSDIDGEAFNDQSGNSVSLNSSGTVLAIGAPQNDGINGANSGHVRVYENLDGTWTQVGSDIDGEAAGDFSGFSVSLSGDEDENILAIGAFSNDGNGADSGHVRVYENLGGTWIQVGSDIDGEAAGDFSGFSTSISSDGSILSIGAPNNDGNGADSGHVRVYENLGGTWTQVGSDIDGEAAFDNFGRVENISITGSVLAIGAPQNDGINGANSGHVRVYENLGSVWTQVGSDIDGETLDDQSGISVRLSNNGRQLAIGAGGNDGINGSNSGHVRVYQYSTLSVTSNTFGPQFRAQPNPSFGNTNIELGDSYHEVEVLIFDLLGKEIISKTYNNTKNIKLDTQQFTTGVYIVNVKANTNKASLKLVVK